MKYGIIVLGDVDNLVNVLNQLKLAEGTSVVVDTLPVKSAEDVAVAPATAAEEEDPWDDPPELGKSGQGSQGTAQSTSQYDKFGNKWVLNLPTAPNCECGIPAGKVHAKSKAGKPYTAWKCRKGLGDQWRDKCAYSELVH